MKKSNPLIDKATTNSETPTPGYLYSEICELSKKDAGTCERILTSLMTKLRSENFPAVKLKVLLVIKHLLKKGNPHFQISLQRISEELRPCLSYRGTPDPIHGEEPYRLVRENAQLVMNMTFEKRILSEEQVMDNLSSNQLGMQPPKRQPHSMRGGRPGFSRGGGNLQSGGGISGNSISGGGYTGGNKNTGFGNNNQRNISGFGNNNQRSTGGFGNNQKNSSGFGDNQGYNSNDPYGSNSIQNNIGLRKKKS
jgi:hypothetical protein